MAKLTRVTAKVFGATADATLTDPEIGQFGSAKAGTYNGTGDVATIQSLPAWSNGWIDAVTPTQQFPPLPEMTGVHKVLSYQNAYLLQQGIAEWDSATNYYTDGFCSKSGKIYISQTDDNLNNDPENDTVNWKEFTSGSSRNIGEIVASTIPLTDAGLHLLDGALINGNGIYSDFVDYIASIYDASANYFTTEASWQDSVTNYGVCGKFVYDSVNNTVRLPKLYSNDRYLIASYSSGTNWYRVYSDGWCEQGGKTSGTGTRTISFLKAYRDTNYGISGAISDSTSSTGDNSIVFGSYNTSSCSLYTNNNTRWQAWGYIDISGYQNAEKYDYIVIATSTKTDIEVDIDEIVTDLNGKADVDLSNVNNSGTSTGASWAMPSDTYEDLTFGASDSTYVAPANGWVLFSRYATDNSYGWTMLGVLKENQTTVSDANTLYRSDAHTNSPSTSMTCFLPVKKGQTFFISYGGASANLLWFRFIYAQGSESEA